MTTNIDQIIDFFRQDQYSSTNRDLFMREFTYSGYNLIDKIPADAHVLDIGCGQNLFKRYLTNLVGIDPATPEADMQITLQQYQPDKLFDVALCLGSIHGDDTEVRQQIIKIHDLLTSHGIIYWRCMPDPPPYKVPSWLSVWSFQRHKDLAAELGFEIVDLKFDLRPARKSPRIYAEWRRST